MRGANWFGPGYQGRGMDWGMGRGTRTGRGRSSGLSRGNPYSFCRFYPWMPRRWWAYGIGTNQKPMPGRYAGGPYQ